MRIERIDDLGDTVVLTHPVRRVVSLVPSLTETVASIDPTLLVGATDWCTHPGDLDVTRVRGTKNPDTRLITQLVPDVVLANKEENRELDVRRLREAGVPVWVSDVQTVPQALTSLERMVTEALGRTIPDWLLEARRVWSGPVPPARTRTVTAVWRDPWMVVGRNTFAGDLLERCGLPNVFADAGERYPKVDVAEIEASGADVVLLPSEPYAFSDDDGPEAFTMPTRLVDGRLLTWYGPSLLDAAATFRAGL